MICFDFLHCRMQYSVDSDHHACLSVMMDSRKYYSDVNIMKRLKCRDYCLDNENK